MRHFCLAILTGTKCFFVLMAPTRASHRGERWFRRVSRTIHCPQVEWGRVVCFRCKLSAFSCSAWCRVRRAGPSASLVAPNRVCFRKAAGTRRADHHPGGATCDVDVPRVRRGVAGDDGPGVASEDFFAVERTERDLCPLMQQGFGRLFTA